MNATLKNDLNYLLLILLSALIFVLDLVTPIGTADGIGYIAVVLFTIRIEAKSATVTAIMACVILTVLGYFLSPSGENAYIGITNRVLSAAGIITAGVIIIRYKEALFSIRDKKNKLKEQVNERTAALEKSLDELRISLEKQEETNTLKTQFISTVSHEFRTPLATIQTSVFLINKYMELGDKEKQALHIDRIKRNIISLTEMMDDVLLVSRQGEQKVNALAEDLDISHLVSTTIDEMNVLVKKGQSIEYVYSGDDIFTFDHKVLLHIIENLISNAIKFSAPGQTINVSTEVTSGMLYLSVQDYGIGISEEDQKHLYERFFRAHNASNIQGTGLGLHIVYNYVKMFGGNIQCISKAGEGTKFVVGLNAVPSPVAA